MKTNLRKQAILKRCMVRLFKSLEDIQQVLRLGGATAASFACILLCQPNTAQGQITFDAVQTNPFSLTDMGSDASPAFADLDSDGDIDLMVGEKFGVFKYFKNIGTSSVPVFDVVQTNPFGLIDIGDEATLSLADLDNDGDVDLMAGEFNGNFKYFQNTGSVTAPAFAAVQTNPFGLTDIGFSSCPALVDLDHDGDIDLMAGERGGNFKYFENTGTSSAPSFASVQTNPFGLTIIGSGSNPAFQPTPSFADLNNDGDLDLVVGESGGNFKYFENTGTASAPSFAAMQTNPFGLTDIGTNSNPNFFDLDHDGNTDLLAGEVFGNFKYFRNTTVPPCTNPTVPILSTSSAVNCGTQSTTLNIQTGTLNNATNWQWYSGSCGGTPVGIGTSIVVSPASTTTYFVRGEGGCIVVGGCGSVTITVNANPSTSINGSSSFCAGSNTLLSSNASAGSGTISSYQWKESSTDISGETNTTYTATAAGSYAVKVINSNNCSTTSTVFAVEVNANQPVSVSIISDESTSTICEGTMVTFTATSSNGGSSPSYQWKVNGGNVGTNSGTYMTSSLANGDTVTCVVTSNITPCPTGNPATSDDIIMNITTPETWYADSDGDTFGNLSVSQTSCTQPVGYVSDHTDCDDGNAFAHPNATEACNDIDDNCNGYTDEGVQSTFYADADNDGYGNPSVTTMACTAQSGYVSNNSDCNDGNASINPASVEVCNGGIDDDCNGLADDSDPGVTGQGTYYADSDGDGYGAGSLILACVQPANTSTNNDDCNDGNASINPAATQVCNGGVDDDCDGLTDDADPSVIGQGTYYADNDGDGYGAGSLILACVQPANSSTNDDDCNDGNAAINPAVTEVCNGGVDDDCDGLDDDADPGVTGQGTYYADNDGDGYGAGTAILSCTQPVNTSTNDDDCDDGNATVNPATTEVCNNIDDDCDATVDEGFDLDGDTYTTCEGDCNDANPAIHPGAAEVLNGLDDNCNGQTDESLCVLSVSAGVDEDTYFGYAPDQCIAKAASITGGTAPFVYSWTLDRPLYDVITSSGDESISGTSSSNVTVCLLDTAVLCITVTDANGCTATDCANINAEDVRCFAGNSGINKVKVCHSKKTICVEENAVAAHIAHGDYLGKCNSSKEEDESPAMTQLLLYPNPTSGKFIIAISLSEDANTSVTVEVMNILGQVVYDEIILAANGELQKEIQLNDEVTDGMYLVKVIINDQVYSTQISYQK